jgi:broad specificity phosphatase PhoE
MRRALHTCDIVFRDHPSKAKIVVVPEFREIMESSNDIGSEIEESMKKYDFDFSQIVDRSAWFVETLEEKDRIAVSKSLEGLIGEERRQKAIEECLRIEKENWFERADHPEKEAELKERILPSFELQKKAIAHYAEKYKRIAIVAHS